MFTNELAESKQTEIVLKDVDETAMETLIDFCYTAKITIDEKIGNLSFFRFVFLIRIRDFLIDLFFSHPPSSNPIAGRLSTSIARGSRLLCRVLALSARSDKLSGHTSLRRHSLVRRTTQSGRHVHEKKLCRRSGERRVPLLATRSASRDHIE